MLSTLARLAALAAPAPRWWIGLRGLHVSSPTYAHYTSVVRPSATQLPWVLWAHPASTPRRRCWPTRRAAVAFLPWLPGLVNDLNMPDSRDHVRVSARSRRTRCGSRSSTGPSAIRTSCRRRSCATCPASPASRSRRLGLAIGVARRRRRGRGAADRRAARAGVDPRLRARRRDGALRAARGARGRESRRHQPARHAQPRRPRGPGSRCCSRTLLRRRRPPRVGLVASGLVIAGVRAGPAVEDG